MKTYFGPNASSTVTKRSFFQSYGAVLFIFLAFLGGWYIGNGRSLSDSEKAGATTVSNQGLIDKSYSATAPDFQLFWDVWNSIKEEYVNQPVNDADLFYGAMKGLVGAVDDNYSEFFDPRLAEEFSAELSGSFSGIGVEVGVKNDFLVVITPLDGSPGQQAGLKPGDRIIAIDGADTFSLSLDQAVSKIRGEEGTQVTLLIVSGDNDPREVVITRQTIEHTGLRWELLDGGIAHLKMSAFDEETEDLLNKFIREVESSGNVNGIVLDLRNNPGGFLDMAIEVASEWVEQGVILRERDNSDEEQLHHARGRARLSDIPTIVLVNEGSASASEIVAGALQDYKIARLIGVTTFGKGSVQKYETLEDGSAYRLTVAKWYTPLERAINEVGVEPDITIELSEDDFNNDRDPQLDAALKLLRN